MKTRNSKGTRRSPKATERKRTEGRSRRPRTAYLGLGSNRGDRRAHLEAALSEIGRIARLSRVSSFYRSDPVGYKDQPKFWNAAVAILWRDSPEELLEAVKGVEHRVGRTPTFRDGPREIDVDILDLGGVTRRTADPVLPHPRLESRRFVLAPLAEIAPEWRHPVSGRTAKEMLATLPAAPRVRRIPNRRPG
ncbi:MAG: 2-amino-4-hydroxy-6-hydroxymethyldihydropteridine diphosphokinase [Thermoanaerobaculia bacterium]